LRARRRLVHGEGRLHGSPSSAAHSGVGAARGGAGAREQCRDCAGIAQRVAYRILPKCDGVSNQN
jgi:hypothetical protein